VVLTMRLANCSVFRGFVLGGAACVGSSMLHVWDLVLGGGGGGEDPVLTDSGVLSEAHVVWLS
jgi:hypothetical protein